MKRPILFLLGACLLLTGCFGTVGGDRSQLNVVWRTFHPDKITTLSYEYTGGGTVLEKEYSYASTKLDITGVEIEADLSGDKTRDFEFILNTKNTYEKVANNKIHMTTNHAEKGSVIVKVDDQEAIVPYEIFPAAVVSTWRMSSDSDDYFSFERGVMVGPDEGDIGPTTPPDKPALKANIATVKIETVDFWQGFLNTNNVHEYEYSEQIFEPDFDNVYVVKTRNGGYAVVRFTARLGHEYSFIYKYSETGVFE